MSAPALTLYGRKWCHLCDDMLAALEALRPAYDFSVTVIDVDSDPALEARFDEIVPVLMLGAMELCRYRFDDAGVRAALDGGENDGSIRPDA
ncbi:glutaredoxin [Pandoraea terrae]|uniref:Glutaredoxin n=1 Tax=Pandoraea terrae TaxID=1537710 RepID=A0A5E4TZ94_9BURK|nr:glutaredoxin family protein [Pandoraea terrae]VVD92068.1 glutaredoxin [Pandoraea terrae]